MNYKEAVEYIHKISWTGSRPGLSRVEELCNALGNPQDKLKFIHVAGTNGKGSFCSMLEGILRRAGYKTGLYTSPYVRYFNERMAINGKMIEDEKLAEIVSYVREFAEKMEDKPTEFELICAIAFEYFYREKCDVVVLEVGMGGRLDATNIINTVVLSFITGIALDHTAFLGSTIPEIAREKAGIIKKNTPVIYGGEDKEAEKVIRETAEKTDAEFSVVDRSTLSVKEYKIDGTTFDYDGFCNLKLSLLGSYQPYNAASVITAVKKLRSLGMEIPDEAIREGLANAVWHARFEVISSSPLVIFDGGHNPEGVDAAIKSVKKYFADEKINVLTAVMADKDYEYIAKRIGEVAKRVYTVRADNPRALSAEEYARTFTELGISATPCKSVADGVEKLIKAGKEENTPSLICGSLYMYEEVANLFD